MTHSAAAFPSFGPMSPGVDGLAGGAAVALIDDDALFRESLGRNLTDAGFHVTSYASGDAAVDDLDALGTNALVLLDWKMPGRSGIDVLGILREAGINVPVIFLTALSDQIYEEAALIGGAVDFVEKSRSFTILLRRIELALAGARTGGPPEPERVTTSLEVGPLDLAVEQARARWQGHEVELTLGEFRMVHHLATNAGRDVRYRALYDLVRGKDFVAGQGIDGYRSNVRTFIKRIRQKFRAVDPEFDAIENYPGFGYRWRTDGA